MSTATAAASLTRYADFRSAVVEAMQNTDLSRKQLVVIASQAGVSLEYIERYFLGASSRGGSPKKDAVRAVKNALSEYLPDTQRDYLNNLEQEWIRGLSIYSRPNSVPQRTGQRKHVLDQVRELLDGPERDLAAQAIQHIQLCLAGNLERSTSIRLDPDGTIDISSA